MVKYSIRKRWKRTTLQKTEQDRKKVWIECTTRQRKGTISGKQCLERDEGGS